MPIEPGTGNGSRPPVTTGSGERTTKILDLMEDTFGSPWAPHLDWPEPKHWSAQLTQQQAVKILAWWARCGLRRFTRNSNSGILDWLSSPPSKQGGLHVTAQDLTAPCRVTVQPLLQHSIRAQCHQQALSAVWSHPQQMGTHHGTFPWLNGCNISMWCRTDSKKKITACIFSTHFLKQTWRCISWPAFILCNTMRKMGQKPIHALLWTFLGTSANNPGLGCNVLSNMVAIYLSYFFFLFNCYSYQPFEQPNSELPWSLGLNFFFFLSHWGKVDFYARLSKVLLFFDLHFRPQSWLEKGKIIHQGAPNLTTAKNTWVSKVPPISFSVGTSRNK